MTTTGEGVGSKELAAAVSALAGGVEVSYETGRPLRNLDATARMVPPGTAPVGG